MHVTPEWYERKSGSVPDRPNDRRQPDDHDLARVIHSASFRRLQSKTQVLGLGESDFYRTRLTHSIEVAQIATGIKRFLSPDDADGPYDSLLPTVPQLTAIALAHDIGHPPFGHGGEVALNFMMRGRGGFEGNSQTLRILAHLERKTEDFGLDLTRRTLLGVLKYPVRYSKVVADHQKNRVESDSVDNLRATVATPWLPPKCYYDTDESLVQWVLEPLSNRDRKKFQSHSEPNHDAGPKPEHGEADFKSLDTSLMDLSDDISYAVHDLEDAIHMKFLRNEQSDRDRVSEVFKSMDTGFLEEFSLQNAAQALFDEKWHRKEVISKLVHCLICSTKISPRPEFDEPLLRHEVTISDDARRLIKGLKQLIKEKVIFSPEVQTLEYKGQQVVMELFQAMHADPERLCPSDTQPKLAGKSGDALSRVVADHISGMTDDYAAKIYERLFTPRGGSLFQKM